ncbi:hypothetical protein FHS86_003181 [Roseimarinus sediminis]
MNIPQYSTRAVNNIEDSCESQYKVLSSFTCTDRINQPIIQSNLLFSMSHFRQLTEARRLKTHVAYEEILK